MTALSHIAFDARVAQMTGKADRELECYAAIGGGDELEWTAFFAEEVDPIYGFNSRHEVCAATRCKLVGAWAEEDDGSAQGPLYAGNRDEIVAMIGESAVSAWEKYAEEIAND